ncbi:aspartate-semialdehyde dehydrogenase [Besnoitia besnoiti]|uniref:Aspartate-semialdehyde dehydrogenase n=1 Tax=Besnoitia besnoiti TaxID=94643 RepID=A0A2A9MBU4_BESBE|nr:aspartate-semialdehyde dehydrogenase [Besnoitia besnoiti]PFH35948.1 aspartate-semialdehyde dehydrogenase [Besnoitia besnoiti]
MSSAGRVNQQDGSATLAGAGAAVGEDGRVKVGIIGATGAVGQRFVSLLHGHPYFRVAALGASDRSAGKPYGSVVTWRLDDDAPLTEDIRGMTVLNCTPAPFKERGCVIIFSALDAAAADTLEDVFAAEGFIVFSNAKSHRMDSDVPILLPYVNAPLLEVVRGQKHYAKTGGAIVTNANCASTGLSVALKPLLDKWGIKRLAIATLQAISGAGYPGLSAMDMIDNVIPFISGEEEKLEREPQKILGTLSEGSREILSSPFESVAMCHRVPVIDGHTVTVIVDFPANAFPESSDASDISAQITDAFRAFQPPADVAGLPSCPAEVICVCEHPSRPQPRVDRPRGGGMTVSVGPVKAKYVAHASAWTAKFTTLVHNTLLGAAGCSILNAELALQRGLVLDGKGQALRPPSSGATQSRGSVNGVGSPRGKRQKCDNGL